MKMLRDLLAIKRFREGQAETAMRQQRQAFLQAQQERIAAEELLAKLLAENALAELQLYQDLCSRLVRLKDIEQVQQTIVVLRQREQEQKDTLEAAQREQQAAQERFDQARLQHKEAARQTSKFVDLASSFTAIHALEAERREDLEMEEAASVARDREDWHANDKEAS